MDDKIQLIRRSPQVLEIRIPYTRREQPHEFLLASDIHLDNPKCDRNLLKTHLKQIQGRGGHALFFGDVLCLMQGKKDRRGSKGSIRPEHLGSNYFDLVFSETAEWFAPFASTILMMSDGNHETAVIGNQEINPLGNVVRLMRDRYDSPVEHLPYQGWVWFTFHQPGANRSSRTRRCALFFHHGAWGGVVTKGTMGGGRYASIAPEADILINGHNHERTIVSHPCFRVSGSGQQRIAQRWHVQTGTYKEEFEGGGGWAVERIVMPKSLGGVWLKLKPADHGVTVSLEPAT
ncbi:MAG: hypothetical protein ACO3TI_07570 [Aquiluna sp.]